MMTRCLSFLAAILLVFPVSRALGEIPEHKIKIGVLQDLPPPFATRTGFGALVAAQLAAGDFGKEHIKTRAEILPGTAKTNPEDDLEQVRDWLEKEDVAAVLSSAPAAVNKRVAALLASHHRTLLIATVGSNRDDEPCSASVVVWGAGNAARTRALVLSLAPQKGTKWFVVSDRTAPGLAAQSVLTDALQSTGGQIVGAAQSEPDRLEVSALGPRIEQATPGVIALMGAGGDLVDAIRAAHVSGIAHGAALTSPFATIEDVDRAGPEAAQGLVLVAPFYWNSDDRSRRFASRWQERDRSNHVSENAAEVYAAVTSFLRAAKAVDDIDASRIGVRLRTAPDKETLFGTVSVRPDGQVAYDLRVYRVKIPERIQTRWDYLSEIAAVPADAAMPARSCPGS